MKHSSRRTGPRLPVLLVLLSLVFPATRALPDAGESSASVYAPGLETVGERQIRAWIRFLACEELEGRRSGERGFDTASRYVASVLEETGIEPGGTEGFYQEFRLVDRWRPPGEAFLEIREAGAESERIPLEGQVAVLSEGPIRWTEKWVFAGRGEGAESDAPDDFHGLDIDGRVVLVVPPEGKGPLDARGAIAAGARKIVVVSDERVRSRAGLRFRTLPVYLAEREARRAGRARKGADIVFIGSRVADRILARRGLNVEGIRSSARRPRGFALDGLDIELSVGLERKESSTRNVIGILEGSDADLRHEYVVIGAHLDHVGTREGKTYHGADDNASGSAAVLAAARGFAALPRAPRRSIAFVFFGAEEMGLFGSRFFVDHPSIPIEDIVLMINLDMVGRDEGGTGLNKDEKPEENVDSLHVVGSRRLSRELDPWVHEVNRHAGLELEYDEQRVWRRSDHFSFARSGVPVVFFFAGFHPDYHQPTDTPEKINYAKVASVSRLALALAFEVADRERRLKINRL